MGHRRTRTHCYGRWPFRGERSSGSPVTHDRKTHGTSRRTRPDNNTVYPAPISFALVRSGSPGGFLTGAETTAAGGIIQRRRHSCTHRVCVCPPPRTTTMTTNRRRRADTTYTVYLRGGPVSCSRGAEQRKPVILDTAISNGHTAQSVFLFHDPSRVPSSPSPSCTATQKRTRR